MERVLLKKRFKIEGDFEPSVSVGSSIRPGLELGQARIPTILVTYEIGNAKLLVDDGTYVNKMTSILEYRKGLQKEIVSAVEDGIIRIRENKLDIISDEVEENVVASVWGKLLSIGEQEYTVESKHLKLPIFVSAGTELEGLLYPIFDKGMIVVPHHIDENVKGRIVIISGALSIETYEALVEHKALAVLAPSVDWTQYLQIFRNPEISVGILHGFGMFPLWQWYSKLFGNLGGTTLEIDFKKSFMHVPISDILLNSLPMETVVFKEYWWGKQVKELSLESGEYIAVLETGEKTPVLAEELFNIR